MLRARIAGLPLRSSIRGRNLEGYSDHRFLALNVHMSLSSAVVPWALVGLALTVLWKLLKTYVAKSPLDNIPGPSPESWTKGTSDVAETFIALNVISRQYFSAFQTRLVVVHGQPHR